MNQNYVKKSTAFAQYFVNPVLKWVPSLNVEYPDGIVT